MFLSETASQCHFWCEWSQFNVVTLAVTKSSKDELIFIRETKADCLWIHLLIKVLWNMKLILENKSEFSKINCGKLLTLKIGNSWSEASLLFYRALLQLNWGSVMSLGLSSVPQDVNELIKEKYQKHQQIMAMTGHIVKENHVMHIWFLSVACVRPCLFLLGIHCTWIVSWISACSSDSLCLWRAFPWTNLITEEMGVWQKMMGTVNSGMMLFLFWSQVSIYESASYYFISLRTGPQMKLCSQDGLYVTCTK